MVVCGNKQLQQQPIIFVIDERRVGWTILDALIHPTDAATVKPRHLRQGARAWSPSSPTPWTMFCPTARSGLPMYMCSRVRSTVRQPQPHGLSMEVSQLAPRLATHGPFQLVSLPRKRVVCSATSAGTSLQTSAQTSGGTTGCFTAQTTCLTMGNIMGWRTTT